jgi:hypothetical protein
MLDGDEGPCVPELFLKVIREKDDRPCPRVELESDNAIAANLFSLAISDHADLVPLWFETLTERMDGEERRAVMGRVVRALMDEDVATHINRPPSTGLVLGRGG